MVPAQEKGAWGIGEEGGESNEAAGEFGQESGEGGHRSMFCKSMILLHFRGNKSKKDLVSICSVPVRRAI